MASSERATVILITGATGGIGSSIVERLATNEHLNNTSTVILLGCRSIGKADGIMTEVRSKTMAKLASCQLDVNSDESIRQAATYVAKNYGHLNVLVNNAGSATITKEPDFSDLRQSFSESLNTNVASVAMVTSLFLPLLHNFGEGAKVINISSGRASLARNASGQLPPTAALAYSVSKTALNMLTLDMARAPGNDVIEFQMANPGHCRTAFNGYKGTRDPREGAIVVVTLVTSKRSKTAHYETIGTNTDLTEIPW